MSAADGVLKLGTRRSLLAWAQSSWVAREVERLNPGIKVELVGIDTRGDQIQDVPLQSIPGKEFFVAELDQALRSKAVDFSVHSLKDLSLERPAEFTYAAIPQRANPRDVALFGAEAIEALRTGRPLRIGTSSPRRLENVPAFLEKALPMLGTRPRVEVVEIRGNINTRLSRVHEPVGAPKQLDGVILAFAGLIRLWADDQARIELTQLLKGALWMVLPLRENPAAPGQGALAVECRADDARAREMIGKLHHEPTARHIDIERGLLAHWGGGCHQKFGATAITHPEAGELLFVRGRLPDGSTIEELRTQNTQPRPTEVRPWDGSRVRGSEGQTLALTEAQLERLAGTEVFVAHSRAVAQPQTRQALEASRIWTSGTPSWFRLAEQGLWVEGCAESLGFDGVVPTLSEGVLQLGGIRKLQVLTHDRAGDRWSDILPPQNVVAAYEVPSSIEGESQGLAEASHVFWSSGTQWDRLKSYLNPKALQFCGPGKTARYLRAQGVEVQVFPSAEEWRGWLGLSKS